MTQYSHSRLNTYRDCPRKYRLRYIDRIRDAEEGIEAFMGSRVHEVLEALYRSLSKSHPVSLDDAVAHYELAWEQNWHDNIKIVRAEYGPDDYRETGRRCIRDYWRRYEPFDQGVVVGIERKVTFELDPEREISLGGYVDRIDRIEDGVYEIHDYKSGAYLPDQAYADADPQLALYQLALESMWPNDVEDVTLVWHYLAFDAELRSKRNRPSLDRLKADTIATIDAIEADREFAPNESNLCGWCGYGALCPCKKHLIEIAELPPEEFHAEDGVRLVNEFVELSDRKSEIEVRMEAVREALIAFADTNELDVIGGSDCKVTIRKYAGLSVPRKGTEERWRLEEAIRQMGKWDEVSGLDTNALVAAVSGGDWDEETRVAVRRFLAECESCRVSKSRLRTDSATD